MGCGDEGGTAPVVCTRACQTASARSEASRSGRWLPQHCAVLACLAGARTSATNRPQLGAVGCKLVDAVEHLICDVPAGGGRCQRQDLCFKSSRSQQRLMPAASKGSSAGSWEPGAGGARPQVGGRGLRSHIACYVDPQACWIGERPHRAQLRQVRPVCKVEHLWAQPRGQVGRVGPKPLDPQQPVIPSPCATRRNAVPTVGEQRTGINQLGQRTCTLFAQISATYSLDRARSTATLTVPFSCPGAAATAPRHCRQVSRPWAAQVARPVC